MEKQGIGRYSVVLYSIVQPRIHRCSLCALPSAVVVHARATRPAAPAGERLPLLEDGTPPMAPDPLTAKLACMLACVSLLKQRLSLMLRVFDGLARTGCHQRRSDSERFRSSRHEASSMAVLSCDQFAS